MPEGSDPHAVSSARARLIRTLRNNKPRAEGIDGEGSSSDSEEQRTSDPTVSRWGERTAESIQVLKGLNTVGFLVVTFSLIFLIASAQPTSKKSQRQLQQFQRQQQEQKSQQQQQQQVGFSRTSVGQGQGLSAKEQWELQHPPVQKYADNNVGAPADAQEQQQRQQPLIQQGDQQTGQFSVPRTQQASNSDAYLPPGVRAAAQPGCQCPAQPKCTPVGRDTLTEAAGTLGTVVAVTAAAFQCHKLWRTKDASSYSSGFLFFSLASSFLLLLHSLGSGNTALAIVFLSYCVSTVFYLWVFVKYPSGDRLSDLREMSAHCAQTIEPQDDGL